MRPIFIVVALALMLSEICLAEPALLLTRVSLDQATHQIIKDSNLRVLGAFTVIIDGKEVHIIKVLTPDGHIRHYRIDAETGNQIN
jgi:hypothetical protein